MSTPYSLWPVIRLNVEYMLKEMDVQCLKNGDLGSSVHVSG